MRFLVIGNHTVHGIEPGGHLSCDPELPGLDALIAAGHLRHDPAPEPPGGTEALHGADLPAEVQEDDE